MPSESTKKRQNKKSYSKLHGIGQRRSNVLTYSDTDATIIRLLAADSDNSISASRHSSPTPAKTNAKNKFKQSTPRKSRTASLTAKLKMKFIEKSPKPRKASKDTTKVASTSRKPIKSSPKPFKSKNIKTSLLKHTKLRRKSTSLPNSQVESPDRKPVRLASLNANALINAFSAAVSSDRGPHSEKTANKHKLSRQSSPKSDRQSSTSPPRKVKTCRSSKKKETVSRSTQVSPNKTTPQPQFNMMFPFFSGVNLPNGQQSIGANPNGIPFPPQFCFMPMYPNMLPNRMPQPPVVSLCWPGPSNQPLQIVPPSPVYPFCPPVQMPNIPLQPISTPQTSIQLNGSAPRELTSEPGLHVTSRRIRSKKTESIHLNSPASSESRSNSEKRSSKSIICSTPKSPKTKKNSADSWQWIGKAKDRPVFTSVSSQ
ncbi:hypothetical protein Ciccas_002078 [Cichlidogyrus casuarinus]|uniref:Uncharacterized protein n=1 Tax=Cichlidogyrus casuarinus TaxID=1844966 RepID=A0ABD2QIB0_9PLAT